MTSRPVRRSLNPLVWFRRLEDGFFALAAEAEYRLKLAPRGTKIVPSDFDRRMIRLFLVAMPLLVGSLYIDDRQFRTRLLVLGFAVALFAVALIFVLDARSTNYTGRGRPLPPPKPRQVPPSSTQPHWTRRRP
ncbi:MAG: hypothetical protein INH02_14745 [Gemmatimonas sp.]|uniref:hypothetical protein n=1 Tax=Gemmatimonas sp. TaxID=1962908 RepID=UPI0025C3AAE0|nr:hypothetical protein [Gemmatimonas sp.]MCA2988670.1 hypothetical protein [Gemmatimonas sp.]